MDELTISNEFINNMVQYSTFVKGIPALSAIVFVFLVRADNSLFYFGLMVALLFCMLGDLRMEKGLILGLPLFLVAHIFFSITFIGKALIIGLTDNTILLTSIALIPVALYIFLFVRFLDSSETGLGDFKVPLIVYCIAIGSMFISTILLWVTTEIFSLIFVSLGGLLFIFSDSVIALREFAGKKLKWNVTIAMTSYYAAIFLLSLLGSMI